MTQPAGADPLPRTGAAEPCTLRSRTGPARSGPGISGSKPEDGWPYIPGRLNDGNLGWVPDSRSASDSGPVPRPHGRERQRHPGPDRAAMATPLQDLADPRLPPEAADVSSRRLRKNTSD